MALHYHTGHPRQDLDWASARTILSAIPGLRYVEIANPAALGRHCSPNYIDAVGRPRGQEEITRVATAAAEAGADVLATIYHSCHREICSWGSRRPRTGTSATSSRPTPTARSRRCARVCGGPWPRPRPRARVAG